MTNSCNDYYIKLRVNEVELELATSDYDAFCAKTKEFLEVLAKTKTIEEIQPEPKQLQNVDVAGRNGFLEVKDNVKISELDVKYASSSQQEAHLAFEDALKKAIDKNEDEFEVNLSKDKELEALFDMHNPSNDLQILLLSAAYLLEMQNQNSFSLKQINSRLMPIKNKVITHSTAQDALDKNYIVVVPDLTNSSDVTEYSLTEAGEDYLRNELG